MKRLKIAIAILSLALVTVIVWQVAQPREPEPVYKGKPLRFWMKTPSMVVEAVHQTGTNAIPTLLTMLRAHDSPLKLSLVRLAKKQHFIKVEYTPAEVLNSKTKSGFIALGAKAQSAVPALIEIANENRSGISRACAIEDLGYIGPAAKDAIPSLLRWATNADVELRYSACFALGRIGAEPDRAIPVLTNALHDPNPAVLAEALKALQQFGPVAKPAVPALVELLNASDEYARIYATNLLKQLDPDAAAKAGVN